MCGECNWPNDFYMNPQGYMENRIYQDENGEMQIAWPRKSIIKEEAKKMFPDNKDEINGMD